MDGLRKKFSYYSANFKLSVLRRMQPTKPVHCQPSTSTDNPSMEDLRKENEYLRAEVAYLKKLGVLLQAKEQAAQKKRK